MVEGLLNGPSLLTKSMPGVACLLRQTGLYMPAVMHPEECQHQPGGLSPATNRVTDPGALSQAGTHTVHKPITNYWESHVRSVITRFVQFKYGGHVFEVQCPPTMPLCMHAMRMPAGEMHACMHACMHASGKFRCLGALG